MRVEEAVSIVVPNYRGERVLRGCVGSILQKYPRVELVVVDDASGDTLKTALGEYSSKKEIKTVQRSVNGGFAATINTGVSQCSRQYLVFLNNDASVREGWLENLLEAIESDSSVGAVQSLIWRTNGVVDCGGGRVDELGFPHETGCGTDAIFTERVTIDYAKAASMMIRAADYAAYGCFDESFFLGYESVDLCWRMRNDGKTILLEPASQANHLSRHASELVSHEIRWFHATKNHLLTFARNATDKQIQEGIDSIIDIREEQMSRHESNGFSATARGIRNGLLYAAQSFKEYCASNKLVSPRIVSEAVDKLESRVNRNSF